MCDIISKIRNECVEIHREDGNLYTIIVGKANANKVIDELKDCGAELHFSYYENIHIKAIL